MGRCADVPSVGSSQVKSSDPARSRPLASTLILVFLLGQGKLFAYTSGDFHTFRCSSPYRNRDIFTVLQPFFTTTLPFCNTFAFLEPFFRKWYTPIASLRSAIKLYGSAGIIPSDPATFRHLDISPPIPLIPLIVRECLGRHRPLHSAYTGIGD